MNDPIFEIPSDPKYVRQASNQVLETLKDLNLTKETLFDLRLCIEEAVINAIKYGNKLNRNLPVTISYSLSGDRLEITVRDCGKGFNYKDIPDPRSENNILKHGGRGLFLISNLMDEVEFNDGGNTIKMVKFLSGGKTHGSKG